MRTALESILPPGALLSEKKDMLEVVIPASSLKDVVHKLKFEKALNFELLTDITCVDGLFLKDKGGFLERFCLVYHFYSLSHNQRLRLKVFLSEEALEVESLSSFYGCANWLEREVYDMFGVTFRNHPDLRRILLYEEFQGHPLRKDYPVDREQPLLPLSPVEER